MHGWYFFGSSKKPEGNGLSLDQIFWLLIIVMSMSAAVFVMGTNIQGKGAAQTRVTLEILPWV